MDIKIHCKYDELVNPKDLKNYSKNRNKHPQSQIERLGRMYRHHGIRHAIIVDVDRKVIAAGHGRKLAAIREGIAAFPVVYQKFETEEDLYTFCQADNALTLESELDFAGINFDIQELGPFDLDKLGIPDFAVDVADKFEGKDADEVPDEVEPVAKLGQVYKLGNHRLMCGDSTDSASVEVLMNGEKADMVFTDPPYGVSYTGGLQDGENGLKGESRKMIKNDDIDLYEDAVRIASEFCIGPVFMFYADTVPFGLYRGIEKVGGEVVALIIWKKKGGYGALGASYKPNHEPCVIWKQKKHKLNFIGDTTENRIWEIDKDGINKLHPTQKPVSIPERAIKNHNAPKVLDLFGGSGSTLIACEKTNRKCYMMELDPHYVDVIIARWEKFTGQKAELLNG
jgi:DNA modification methylase